MGVLLGQLQFVVVTSATTDPIVQGFFQYTAGGESSSVHVANNERDIPAKALCVEQLSMVKTTGIVKLTRQGLRPSLCIILKRALSYIDILNPE
jgi:hypothetical protein